MALKKHTGLTLSALLLLSACSNDDDGARLDNGQVESTNPLASPDQLAAESLALELISDPSVQKAREVFKQGWLAIAQANGAIDELALASFDDAVDESIFTRALSFVNQDAARPKVVNLLSPPHKWYGLEVPGSRTAYDNPDTIYYSVPVSPKHSYVLHGKAAAKRPTDVNVSLWDARSITIANLTLTDIPADENGEFRITVNAGDGDGKTPHLKLVDAANSIMIRNTVPQWGEQEFERITVERVDELEPDAEPVSTEELIAKLAASLEAESGVSAYHYYESVGWQSPVNTLPEGGFDSAEGRLATQISSYMAFALEEDEALIFHAELGGAKYFTLPAYNRWMITTDYVNHTQTLNHTQALPNDDGSYTFVISVKDPGVYNWVDTVGVKNGFLLPRWQNLPKQTDDNHADASLKLVKLDQLKDELPASTKWVTAKEREEQLRARKEGFAKRYAER